MRKSIIFGALAALLGLAVAAQASGKDGSAMSDTNNATQQRTADSAVAAADRSEPRDGKQDVGKRHGDNDRDGGREGRERASADRD